LRRLSGWAIRSLYALVVGLVLAMEMASPAGADTLSAPAIEGEQVANASGCSYDGELRLPPVTAFVVAGLGSQSRAYDPFGRRVSKTHHDQAGL
jgi:hypothetical protein